MHVLCCCSTSKFSGAGLPEVPHRRERVAGREELPGQAGGQDRRQGTPTRYDTLTAFPLCLSVFFWAKGFLNLIVHVIVHVTAELRWLYP